MGRGTATTPEVSSWLRRGSCKLPFETSGPVDAQVAAAARRLVLEYPGLEVTITEHPLPKQWFFGPQRVQTIIIAEGTDSEAAVEYRERLLKGVARWNRNNDLDGFGNRF